MLVIEILGKQSLLSASDVEKLLAARGRYGISHPGPSGSFRILTSCDDSVEEAAERITMTRPGSEALIGEAL